MIDIIIPSYNSSKTIKSTIDSILSQSIKDKVCVYVVDDASTETYDEIISLYKNKLNITLLRLDKNVGPGGAREHGINNSNSEFIVFMDSDDIFYKDDSLEYLFKAITESKADMVITDFVEEVGKGFIKHELNFTWFHGKIYRRKFIKDNNIHINDSRRNEDEGFNQLCFLLTENIVYEPTVTYVWKNNRDSLTRKDHDDYNIKQIYGYAYNIRYALENALKIKENPYKLGVLSYKALLYLYFFYIENKESLNMYMFNDNLKYIKEIYLKFPLNNEDTSNIYNIQYNACLDIGMKKISNSKFTFNDYLDIL